MFKDNLKMTGVVQATLVDSDGKVKETVVTNLVVNTGKSFVASRMVGTVNPVMSHIAIGTGTMTQTATDTMLQIETSRVALTSGTFMDNIVTYTATFGPGIGTGAVTEAGIFNADTGGIMLARTTFPVLNKQAGDSILINWQITAN